MSATEDTDRAYWDNHTSDGRCKYPRTCEAEGCRPAAHKTAPEPYTPTDEEVRNGYATAFYGLKMAGEEFDGWLAARDERVRREVLDGALGALGAGDVQAQWPNECWDGIWAAINAIESYRDSAYPE